MLCYVMCVIVSMLTTIAPLLQYQFHFFVARLCLSFLFFYFTNLGTQSCINQYAEIQTSVTQNLLKA